MYAWSRRRTKSASPPRGVARGVDPGDQSLRRGFFVAAGAVDLAGEKQARDLLRLQRRADLRRPDHVVLDRVAVAQDLRVLQARDQPDDLLLHVGRQATC